MSVRRRISLPATAETEQIVRLSRRLTDMVQDLHRKIDELPLVIARRDAEEVVVQRGTDRGAEGRRDAADEGGSDPEA